MKRSIHYRQTFARVNHIKAIFLSFFFNICSLPRLLLEVFIRTNFGERYFGLHAVLFLFAVLFSMPFLVDSVSGYSDPLATITGHFVWYAYLIAFLVFGIKHHREIKRSPEVFNFQRFSQSNGVLNARVENFINDVWFRLTKRVPSSKALETYLEPLPFFLLGLVSYAFDPVFGALLMVCAVIYMLSFKAAYWLAEGALLDINDDRITAEQTKNIVVKHMQPRDTQGVNFRFRKPTEPDMKERVADQLVYDDEPAARVI